MRESPSEGAGIASRLRRWQALTLTLLVVGYAGYYLCRSNLAVATPRIVAELAAGGTAEDEAKMRLGWLVTLGTLAYAAGKFLGGTAGDFFGGRSNFLGGMAGSVLFTALFAVAGGVPAFTLVWMANRFVQSFGWPGMVKVASRWVGPAAYGTVMGILSLSFLFGDAAARWFMGSLLDLGLGWRGVFWTCAAVLAGLLAVCAVLLRESPGSVGVAEGGVNPLNVYGASGRESRPVGLAALLLPLLRSRAFVCVCLLSLALTLLRETFNSWTPLYFKEVVKLSEGSAARQSAWFPLLGGVSVLLSGALGDVLGRTGRATIILAGMALTGAALWALGELPAGCHPAWPVVLVTLVGFLLIGPYSYLAGALALDFGGKRGSATAAGIIDGVGYLGGALGGAGFAGLLRSQGWSGSFAILAVMAWGTCAIALYYWWDQFSRRLDPPP